MALYKWDIKVSGVGGAFSPENPWSTWQVLKKTATGYSWENWNENVFVTQQQYDQLPSSKLTDWKTYFIYSQTSQWQT